ncbi:hypothetical protein OH491_15040 [Termitidicoccus mucosus]|uniref:Uncharacterized protein n=1 Tax=Termitidicoccus mucosus TaxID=1184151 RepID=A0A178IBI8_9BACT|nr:hypothetical protein AW736_25735 [Opitutaceae bacterium TSB47]
MENTTEYFSLLVLAAALAVIMLARLNARLASPVLSIINRWLRCLVFSGSAAYLFQRIGGFNRPYWLLALVCLLVWILAETLYNWMMVKALSMSPLPLFPHYSVNTSGDEWPTHPRFLKVRDWLRTRGFSQVQALRAEISNDLYLRVSVYQDADAVVRLQITFLPQPGGAIALCASFSTRMLNGYRYVTDNLFLPFAGFYPENWLVERNPWRVSLEGLYKRHRARLARRGEIIQPWDGEPLEDLNVQQREMDKINTELGFLMPYAQREEHGKITYEGRFRVWKEIWSLNYLGRSARYE